MSTALATMDEMSKMAAAMIKSKMFGFKTVEEAMSIMLIAQAEGRPAALAARDYNVIQGRPALKADAMLARFQQEGGVVEWDEYTDTKVTGRFSHPKSCPKPVAVTWTIEMAKKIGLANKDNWARYPRAMLRARVVSEGVRTTYPGIAVGIYTVEEVQDFAPEKNITPLSGAGGSLTDQQREEIDELADKVREWMNQGSLTDAWAEIDNASLEADQQMFLWTHFDSRIRRQLKEEGERQRIKASAKAIENKISEPQRIRLEARISAAKLSRDSIKEMCEREFSKEHFADLTAGEYNIIDQNIDYLIENSAPPPSQTDAPPLASVEAVAEPTDAALVADIEGQCKRKKFDFAFDLACGIKDSALRESTEKRIARAKAFVDAREPQV